MLKDLKDIEIVTHIISSFNLPVWALQKPDGSCRMKVD